MDKRLNARIQHKIDTQENWEKAVNFIPLKGEWIFYDKDAENADIRLKIGDGETNVNELPFVSTGGSGNSQSVQPDYEQNDAAAADYIKNRPFYDLSKEYTFNGVITSDTIITEALDLTTLLGAHISMVRLGDPIDNISKLENQIITVVTPEGTQEITITSEELSESLDGIQGMIVEGLPYLLNVNDPNDLNLFLEDPFGAGIDLDFTFPEVGLYSIFAQMVDDTGALTGQQVYINKLVLNEIKTIDTKFLPEPLQIGYKGTKINWNGNPTPICLDLTDTFGVKFYKVAEPINTIYNARYSYTSTDLDVNSGGYTINDTYYVQIEGAEYSSRFDLWNVNTSEALTVDTTPIGGPGVVSMPFPEPGLYFVWNNADSFIKGFVSADYDIKTLNEEFLPKNLLTENDKNVVNGVAGLDYNGKIYTTLLKMDEAYGIPSLNSNGLIDISKIDNLQNIYEQKTNKGIAYGYASLDSQAQITSTQLPTISVEKGGTGQTSYEDTIYSQIRYRGSALSSTEQNPTLNGTIIWVYE